MSEGRIEMEGKEEKEKGGNEEIIEKGENMGKLR